jgi:hypothetical protein
MSSLLNILLVIFLMHVNRLLIYGQLTASRYATQTTTLRLIHMGFTSLISYFRTIMMRLQADSSLSIHITRTHKQNVQ